MSQEETYVRLFYGGMSLLVPMSFVLNAHPGGAEYILQYANQDITTAFADMNHSADAEALLQTFEEKEDKRGYVLYNPDQGTATKAEPDGLTAESRRLAEVRWWRRRQWCAMTATVAAATVVAAFALRRGSVQRS